MKIFKIAFWMLCFYGPMFIFGCAVFILGGSNSLGFFVCFLIGVIIGAANQYIQKKYEGLAEWLGL